MSVTDQRERILDRRLDKEMKDSFLDYAMSVIVQRALPDVRDGLKPVHRRILFAMHGLGLQPDRSHQKSATVVGEVLGKFHPHGDGAVYDALVRMVQSFSLRYPLVDGQGNFGSIDGDPAAAYRYTEARLSHMATELLDEIGKDTVVWQNNFDERMQEPTVLPCRFPNLLVNGCAGIAVGMSTNVPPHNLAEVAEALRLLVAKPDCTVADLMEKLPGPDFPTGGFILGREGIRKMYETGRGRMVMRARVVSESLRGGRKQLVVTELPYATSKSRIVTQIAALSRKGVLPDVADLRDESDREGIRLVVELKRGAKLPQVMGLLFRKTSLQQTFGAILLALDGGAQPDEFTLKGLLEHFREHRLQVIRRRSRFELEKAQADLHITQGLLSALDRIDEVIAIIRASPNRAEASTRLQEDLGLSDLQAEAILNMRLARLTGLEQEQLRAKESSLIFAIRQLRALLGDEALQLKVMLEELDEVVERLSDERRTVILDSTEGTDAQYIDTGAAAEDVVVTITREGYMKRIPMHLYRRRVNAGMALADMDRHETDYLERIVVARTGDWLLSVTSQGRLYFLKVEDIPEGSRSSRGRAIYTLLDIDRADSIVATLPVNDLKADRFLTFVTKAGIVKRTRLSTFSRPRKGGLIAATVRPGDSILDVTLTPGDADLLLLTRTGRAIRFGENEVSVVGATAQGVKGIGLKDDRVIGVIALIREAAVLVVTDRGSGKRTPLADFNRQKRGGLGMTIKLGNKGERLVSAMEVLEDDLVMLVSAGGTVTKISAREIEFRKRLQTTKQLVELIPGDRIVEVTRTKETGGSGKKAKLSGEAEVGDSGDKAEPTDEPAPQTGPNRIRDFHLQGELLDKDGGVLE